MKKYILAAAMILFPTLAMAWDFWPAAPATPAQDTIRKVTFNENGSVDAVVTFDSGTGVEGVTVIALPAPKPEMGIKAEKGECHAETPGIPRAPASEECVLHPAVEWTADNVTPAIQKVAAAKKAAWIAAITKKPITGPTKF